MIRSKNEDFCFTDPSRGIYLLADGMGGARAGETASKLAVETVAEMLTAHDTLGEDSLLRAIEAANAKILSESRANPKLEGMGTTLVAALDCESSFVIASVGDSRAYVCNAEGLRLITEDQTWVQEVGRPLGLDEETLNRHPMRHVLTMALGVSETIEIHHYRVPISSAALFLLCSDGLHGVISRSRLETILREDRPGASTLDEKCYSLIQAAREAGGPDNITVVLIRVS